jgi:hypothetical protein
MILGGDPTALPACDPACKHGERLLGKNGAERLNVGHMGHVNMKSSFYRRRGIQPTGACAKSNTVVLGCHGRRRGWWLKRRT